jgi:hypothetical protein
MTSLNVDGPTGHETTRLPYRVQVACRSGCNTQFVNNLKRVDLITCFCQTLIIHGNNHI